MSTMNRNEAATRESSMSRRSFLAGLTALGMGAAALSGCTSGNGNGGADTSSLSWDKETDVLVVGYGGAGASAAIAAAEAGANVLIIEKAPEGDEGGNTGVAGGAFLIPDGKNMDAAFEFLRYQMPEQTTTDEEINGYLDELVTLPDWLDAHSIPSNISWSEVATAEDGSAIPGAGAGAMYSALPTSYGMNGIGFSGSNGQSLFAALKKAAETTAGISIEYETAGAKLIFNPETKEVYGVIAVTPDGEAVRIKANRGVVLACGGFENNKQMLTTFYPPNFPIYPCGTPYNTGDGIRMVHEIGAKMRGFSSVEWGCHCCKEGSEEIGVALAVCWTDMDTAWPHSVMVNDQGKRFVNESASTNTGSSLRCLHDKTQIPELAFDMERLRYANVPMYLIFDQERADIGPFFNTASAGSGNHWANIHGLYAWSEDNQAEVEKGWLKKADTIEELAEQLGIDAKGLAAEIKKYNEFCAAENDTDFGRTRTLSAVATPPFYGCELGLGLVNTQGGPTRNAAHQVLDYDDQIIPRLYAGGELGSIYGWLYQGAGNIPEAMGTRVAGENAANETPWE